MPYTILSGDPLAVGTGNPPSDMNNVNDVLLGMGAQFSVLNTAYAGGADRTGVNDSTSAFQAAINAVAPAGGGVVRVPAGTYKLAAAQLNVTTGLHLIGDGYASTQINCTGSGSYAFNLDPPGYSTSSHVENLEIRGLTLNATGMDIFWGANIIRSRIAGNYLVQNSGGNCVMNVSQATGTNGATYLAETYFNNKEFASGTRTIEAWHLDFSGTGLRGNDNVWDGAGTKIWTGTGAYWLRLIGDATLLGSKHCTWRDLVFENSGGTGGHLWLQNTSEFTIENHSCEDLSSGTVSNPLIKLNAYTTGPGCQGGVIRHYSRRSGSNISNTLPDILLDSNCTQITIDSPTTSSGGTALTVDFGSATNCVRSGAWPTSSVILNRGTGNTYV